MAPPNLEILAYEATELGVLCLRRRKTLSPPQVWVTEVTLNHEFLMSSLHTASEQALAAVALDIHGGSQLDVLVGGLGLGYTAQAVLSSDRVARVEVVELLLQVIDWLAQDMIPLAPQLKADRRLDVVSGDVYARLAGPPQSKFDLILIDVDHSPDDQLAGGSAGFYTEAGLVQARAHLAPGGVLGVWSYAESSPFADALRRVFQEVRTERVAYFNRHVGEEHTDWLFFAREAGGG